MFPTRAMVFAVFIFFSIALIPLVFKTPDAHSNANVRWSAVEIAKSEDRIFEKLQIFESLAEHYQPGTADQPNPNHDEKKYDYYIGKMLDAASRAAPYVHHRLASMVHTGPNDGAIKIEAINSAIAGMSDKDLKQLEQLLEPLAAAARVTPGIADSSRAGNPSKKH